MDHSSFLAASFCDDLEGVRGPGTQHIHNGRNEVNAFVIALGMIPVQVHTEDVHLLCVPGLEGRFAIELNRIELHRNSGQFWEYIVTSP